MKNFCAVVSALLLASLQPLFAQIQGQWVVTGTMQTQREFHAQVSIAGGKALSIGGAGVLSIISVAFAMPGGAAPVAAFVFLPVRLVISLVSSVFSAAVSNWFIASFAALKEERT